MMIINLLSSNKAGSTFNEVCLDDSKDTDKVPLSCLVKNSKSQWD